MSNLLDDVVSFLASVSLVDDVGGWSGFKGYLPTAPDKAIVIYETGGATPSVPKTGDSLPEMDQVTFQVRGRGDPRGMEALRGRMGSIYRALHGGDLGSDFVLARAIQSGPLSLGLDGNDRPGLTWNFEAFRRRDADT